MFALTVFVVVAVWWDGPAFMRWVRTSGVRRQMRAEVRQVLNG